MGSRSAELRFGVFGVPVRNTPIQKSAPQGLREPRRKITEMKLPVHFMRPVGEPNGVLIENGPGLRFVAPEVTKRSRMLKGERQRLNRAVKAHEPNRARQIPRCAQDGERVGGRTQADIPDHEFPGMFLEALAEPELIDVERFRLSYGTDDRMKGLGVRQRMDAVIAADELNEFVAGD